MTNLEKEFEDWYLSLKAKPGQMPYDDWFVCMKEAFIAAYKQGHWEGYSKAASICSPQSM